MMQQTLFQARRSSDADQLHDEEDHEEDDDELHACKKSKHQRALHDGDDDQDADEDDGERGRGRRRRAVAVRAGCR